MNKAQVMEKFGFQNSDDFDVVLLELGIEPETEELTPEQVETLKNHVTVFASALTVVDPATAHQGSENGNSDSSQNGNGHQTYTPPTGAMSVITNQGLQLAKETGLNISQGALETLSQLTFDKGRLDAAFLENAYWLGLLRQQNQLRAANTEKFIQLLQAQQSSNLDIVKKLSIVAKETHNTNLHATVAAASNW